MKQPLIQLETQGLSKVISGGQCGIDQAGLFVASEFGLLTGGMAPKGWRTWYGPAPMLGTLYGLEEHHSSEYPPRTEENVKNSDATIIMGKNPASGGSALTAQLCRKHKKPHLIIQLPHNQDDVEKAQYFLQSHAVSILNIAGNRDVNKESPVNFCLGTEFLRELFSSMLRLGLLNNSSINNSDS